MMEGILLEEALKLILDKVHIVTDTVNTAVGEAGGRILAEDVYAPLDNPPFPRSPVDGYAVSAWI